MTGISSPLHYSTTKRLLKLPTIGAMLLLPLFLRMEAQAQSALDGFDPNANDSIRVVVVQPDGKILLGGDFTSLAPNGGPPVTRNRIARLNADGTLDTAFDPNADGTIYSIAVQADGKIVAGGYFSTIGGQTRNHIARIDAASGLADSFDPNADNTVQAVAVQPDGRILLGGVFTALSPNGGAPVVRNRIARLNPGGTLDPAFNPGSDGLIYTIVVQADGKILAGGTFTGIGGQARNFIARLDAATGLADSFNPDIQMVGGHVLAIAVQADGKILAGGWFTSVGGQARNNIARLDATTGQADSFDPNATDRVLAIAVQPDGKILTGGSFHGIGGQTRNWMARLDATSGLADAFDANMTGSDVRSIAVQKDGKILAGGAFASAGGKTRNRIARLETDGRLDQTLNLSTVGTYGLATAIQPDGKILIGGSFTTVLGVARNNIARLNADGTLDTAFNPNANGDVFSIAVQANGRILVGGDFLSANGNNSIGGEPRNFIARLDPTTGLADSFNPNANSIVGSIAVQVDGKILAGGQFFGANSIGGQTRNRIARLDAVTGLADSFDPNADNNVSSIAVQADGKILAGGFFTGVGGQVRNHIARLDPTTGLADSFDANARPGPVLSIAVLGDGKILAGGGFSNAGGQARNFIVRLDPTTGLADSFNPNANEYVLSIAVQEDGKILAGGGFTNIGGQTRNHIARLDATTGLADSFNPNANDFVGSIALEADGKILAGGNFTSIGGQNRSLFARLSNDTAALQNLAVTQTTIPWTRAGSSPRLTRVGFEFSTDSVNYVSLGGGTVFGGNWTLLGLSLPIGENIYIRARGYYRTGDENASESMTESVRNAFLAGPAPTPTPTPSPTPASTAAATATPTATATPIASPTATATPSATATGTPTVAPSATPSASATATATPTATVGVTATPTPSPTSTPTPSPSLTPIPGPTPSATPTATPGPTPATQALNLSTRMRVQTGDNVGIGGFIVTGSAPKHVVLRAIGPSLGQAGVPDALADPLLELHGPTGFVTLINDNWRDDQEVTIAATGLAPINDLESAIEATLAPGAYTAIVRGNGNSSGVALVEVYNINQSVFAKLANLSTRAIVGMGDDIVIAGFILGGGPPLADGDRIVLRGIGPSLTPLGVANALADPKLELRDSDGALLASNNDWQDDSGQAVELTAAGLAPTNNLESGLAVTLPPGLYTALLSGANNGAGIGLVEVYDRGTP